MEPQVAAGILARALNDGQLIAIVGSMASADYEDSSGRTFKGLPTVGQILKIARDTYDYLTDESFEDTFDKILSFERRAEVEQFLCRYFGVSASHPVPPCHKLLAWLPFAAYLTSNYDQFIENTLAKEGRDPHVLIENEDLVRANPRRIPVVKYHGCVSRPRTLVACTSDYENLEAKRRLVRNYISSMLAGKVLLVVGHGLRDNDLRRILLELTESLGALAPSIYLLRSPGNYDKNFSLGNVAHEVISEDLTQFLSRLEHSASLLRGVEAKPVSENVWLSSNFFTELRMASVLPSETQVIDTFLRHLHSEFSARADVLSVVEDAKLAMATTLEERPNYGALERIWNVLEKPLRAANSPQGAEVVVQSTISQRMRAQSAFNRIGAEMFNSNERVLLFSQSQRVLQVLLGVPPSLQRNIHLYVCECRPKSPATYQDAAAICASLAETDYKVTVCPDVVGLSLLATKQIDRVIMGTHALYHIPDAGIDSVHSFVNTCGANAICLVAEDNDVFVDIIGEELKLEPVSAGNAQGHVHLHQEEDLWQHAHTLRGLQTRAGEVGHINIGYDLVEIGKNLRVHVPRDGERG